MAYLLVALARRRSRRGAVHGAMHARTHQKAGAVDDGEPLAAHAHPRPPRRYVVSRAGDVHP